MAPLQRSKSAIQATDQLQIQHFIHQHLLHKVYMTLEFNCDGCNMGGYGVRYRCSACDFDLHEQCATSPHRMFSHLHPHHQLVLVNRPGDSHFCGVCRGFTNGLSYTCECQTCEFDVHPLCIKIPVANGVPSVNLDHSQQAGKSQTGGVSWGQPTTQHVNINQQQLQQKQGIPATSFGGYYELNHNQQQKQGMPFGGYYELNHNQPVMVNHPHQQHQQQQQQLQQQQLQQQQQHQHRQHQQQQQLHQQQPGLPTVAFNGYPGVNNGQPMMINHQQQPQQQGMPTTAFNGYNGVNTNQTMINHHQQQPHQQGMPATTTFGGYNGVNNNNQSVMSNQQQQQQQQQPAKSSNYSKMGKFAANILTTSIIGVPLFNQRN